MATYAVGDIQGCFKPLQNLLEHIEFDPGHDRLWAVGDLINRGPRSLKTLRFLKSLGPSFTSVLGNHDLHFLALASGANPYGKKETLKKLLKARDCSELADWLRHFPLIHREVIETDNGPETFLMVHAGLEVGWTIDNALGYASEVERELQGENYRAFLASMYGDKPRTWREDLKGKKRRRLITNILTRMRFCTGEGKLNLNIKTRVDTAPAGYRPWFEFIDLPPDTHLLFGHWATLDGVTNIPNIHALDTGCVWKRSLTAMRLEDKKRFSVEYSK